VIVTSTASENWKKALPCPALPCPALLSGRQTVVAKARGHGH